MSALIAALLTCLIGTGLLVAGLVAHDAELKAGGAGVLLTAVTHLGALTADPKREGL